jgi:hypothetical protein
MSCRLPLEAYPKDHDVRVLTQCGMMLRIASDGPRGRRAHAARAGAAHGMGGRQGKESSAETGTEAGGRAPRAAHSRWSPSPPHERARRRRGLGRHAGAAWLAAVGVVLAVGVLVGGALRLRVAYRADRSEERWLRGLLSSLGDHPAEGEDEDLLVP